MGIYSVVFKTTQGRSSEAFEGDEMEYMDPDDMKLGSCYIRNFSNLSYHNVKIF